jgi:2-phosphoglycolate phosphatase
LDWTSRITAILFDLDGTLIDSTEAIILSTNQALKKMGKPLFSPQFIRSRIGYRLEDAILDWEEPEKKRLLQLNHHYYHAICLEKTSLMEGARETLLYLRNCGFRLGVATGKKRGLSSMILEHLELLCHVEAIVGSDDVERMKPDPETLLRALAALGVKPENAVYVGDTLVDVQASKRAGVRCIAVLGGTDSLEDIRREEPDCILDNLCGLMEIFRAP